MKLIINKINSTLPKSNHNVLKFFRKFQSSTSKFSKLSSSSSLQISFRKFQFSKNENISPLSLAAGKEMSSQKISVVSDPVIGVHSSAEKQSSSFVVDLESFATWAKMEHRTPSSRIIRKFSRKESIICGNEKITSLNQIATDPPRGSSGCSPNNPMAVVDIENPVGSDHHHHVTITKTDLETRWHGMKLNNIRSHRRRQSVSAMDPRYVLFIFAIMSSLGSLMLIYFTLAIKKMNAEA